MTTRPKPPPSQRTFFNPFPKYLQIRQVLERRMSGEYEIDQQIPTEQALCEEFGVARETVRQALRTLEDDGIIERHRARGSFLVRRPAQAADSKVTGLVEDLTALKLDTHAVVLATGPVKTPADSRDLGMHGNEVFRIRRLRYFENKPLVVHDAFLPDALGKRVAALDLTHASISQLLEKRFRIKFVEEKQQVEAMVADTELAQLLDVPIGAPVLLIRRFLRLHNEQGSVLFDSYYRADRYRYTVNLAPALTRASRRRP
jgi:GntR family transcriptional regulator